MTYSNAEVIDSNEKKTGYLVVEESEIMKAGKFKNLLRSNGISTLTVVAEREAIEKAGLFCENELLLGAEDYALWLRISALYPGKVKGIKNTLAQYRRHENNISASSNIRALDIQLNILTNLLDFRGLSNVQKRQVSQEIITKNQMLSSLLDSESSLPKPDISVVMSAYNGGEYLKKAIESILKQSYRNFEFIIIDDGSTDNSYGIISSYRDRRIRLIKQENSGLVASLNKALLIARSNIIARMDADDISLPERLEKEYTWIIKSPHRGLVSTFFEHIDFESSNSIGEKIVFPIKNIDLKRALYFVNPFAHGAAMYRKDAVIKVGKYSSKYGPAEDYDLWRRMAKIYEIGIIPEVLFQYRINNPKSESKKKITIQNKYVALIHDELWKDKFYKKSILSIVHDYYMINKKTYTFYTDEVKNEYISHQYILSKFAARRNYLLRSAKITVALLFISPTITPKLFSNIMKGFLNQIKKVSILQ
jgi:glycosyltransferase involved in cell wall biosynthesis